MDEVHYPRFDILFAVAGTLGFLFGLWLSSPADRGRRQKRTDELTVLIIVQDPLDPFVDLGETAPAPGKQS